MGSGVARAAAENKSAANKIRGGNTLIDKLSPPDYSDTLAILSLGTAKNVLWPAPCRGSSGPCNTNRLRLQVLGTSRLVVRHSHVLACGRSRRAGPFIQFHILSPSACSCVGRHAIKVVPRCQRDIGRGTPHGLVAPRPSSAAGREFAQSSRRHGRLGLLEDVFVDPGLGSAVSAMKFGPGD